MSLQIMQWTIPISSILPLITSGVFVGALAVSFAGSPNALWFSGVVCVALAVLVWVRRSRVFVASLIVMFGAGLSSLGGVYFDQSTTPSLAQFENKKVELTGTVIEDPEFRETQTRLTVLVEAVNETAVSGRVLVSTNPYDRFSYGDRVVVSGTLKEPEAFETTPGRTFNYPKYLYAHRITHTVSFAEVVVRSEGGGAWLPRTLLSVKRTLVSQIETLLPDPEAPLLSGLLLGERQSLGDSLYEAFQRAGVVHIIVLSGYNVSLVVQVLIKVSALLLPRMVSMVAALFGIVAFALMTGASETTVRASIMAGVLLIAAVSRRPGSGIRALMVAGSAMVIMNPYLVLYDASFQLSFLATAGILLWGDTISDTLRFIPTTYGFRDIAAATLSAQWAVLPLLIISFGSVSVVAPFANLAVLGAVPYAMLFGFIAAAVSFVHPFLAFPFTALTWVLLWFITTVSVWFGNLPFATVAVPQVFAFPLALAVVFLWGWFAVRLFLRREYSA